MDMRKKDALGILGDCAFGETQTVRINARSRLRAGLVDQKG